MAPPTRKPSPPKKASASAGNLALTPDTPTKVGPNWFPGHMAKAIREIKARLRMVDVVLEIRDARAPLVSGNKALDELLGQKSRFIVLNKANLADPSKTALWEEWFKSQGQAFAFIDCFDKASMKHVLQQAKNGMEEKRRECNPEEELAPKIKFKMMIIGLPNTGKSTIINQLANRNAAKTADKPGQTQVQLWINVDETLELLDTPGVLPPEIENEEHALWLSALNAIPDEVMGEEMPACYLVKYFLKAKSETFKERYKLESFELGLEETLKKIATVRGCLKQKGLPDLDRVYKLILADFRKGELGKTCFGLPPKV